MWKDMQQLPLMELGIPDTIFISKKVWDRFSDSEMEQYVERVFSYYRKHGFPYYPTDREWRDSEFSKLIDYKPSVLVSGNVLRQTMHGLALAWSYFPHSFSVQCHGFHSPLQTFLDDELLIDVIRRRIKLGDNMSDAGLRKMLRMFTGSQGVSNFRPTAARAIYTNFLPHGGVALDTSMGYGGRLLGAITANVDYIGCDPDTKTFAGNRELAADYAKGKMDTQMYNVGSEDLDLPEGCVDFAFTSPPYFDTERYSDEPTQSYIKFPTVNKWLNGFMRRTLVNIHNALRANSYLAINVSPIKQIPSLPDDVKVIAESIGFSHVSTWKYTLSRLKVGDLTPYKDARYKYEPILIFRRL